MSNTIKRSKEAMRSRLPYSDDEIRELYMRAKDKAKEIIVLVDLCCIEPCKMVRKLHQLGVQIPEKIPIIQGLEPEQKEAYRKANDLIKEMKKKEVKQDENKGFGRAGEGKK